MFDPRPLYSVATGENAPRVQRSVPLINVIPGMMDAGQVGSISARYLLDSLAHERLVTFDSDDIIDFRSSRPLMSLSAGRFELSSLPTLTIDAMQDQQGRQFLLLSGPEPDMRWGALASAIADICDMFDVSAHVSMRAFPAEVPHTRMIPIMTHANLESANRPETGDSSQTAPTEIPGSFSVYLETVLEHRGIASQGFVAQLPHYLARSSMPSGALALLRRVSEALSLTLPLVELGDIVETASRLFESEIQQNPDLQDHVTKLEEAYDSHYPATETDMHTILDMPTANEIGERLERFLAEEIGGDSPEL